MKDCNSKPTTTFKRTIEPEKMRIIKDALDLDQQTPIIIIAPDKDSNIELLAEEGKYTTKGFPPKEVSMEHIESFTIVRSTGSNFTTIATSSSSSDETSGGNIWTEDVDWG